MVYRYERLSFLHLSALNPDKDINHITRNKEWRGRRRLQKIMCARFSINKKKIELTLFLRHGLPIHSSSLLVADKDETHNNSSFVFTIAPEKLSFDVTFCNPHGCFWLHFPSS